LKDLFTEVSHIKKPTKLRNKRLKTV